MYADDMLLLSKTESGLQKSLDILEEYLRPPLCPPVFMRPPFTSPFMSPCIHDVPLFVPLYL